MNSDVYGHPRAKLHRAQILDREPPHARNPTVLLLNYRTAAGIHTGIPAAGLVLLWRSFKKGFKRRRGCDQRSRRFVLHAPGAENPTRRKHCI